MSDETPKTIVCTLDSKDGGPACPYCGYATGDGHGKKWER